MTDWRRDSILRARGKSPSRNFVISSQETIPLARHIDGLDIQGSNHSKKLKSHRIKAIDLDVETIYLLFPF